MSIPAYRWQMNKPGEPFERVAFNAAVAAGEVVVAIAGCGVCHTDLGYYYDGVRTNIALPLTLGHRSAVTWWRPAPAPRPGSAKR